MNYTTGHIGLIFRRLDADRDSALARRVLGMIRARPATRAFYRLLPRAEMRERGPNSAAVGWTCVLAFSGMALVLALGGL